MKLVKMKLRFSIYYGKIGLAIGFVVFPILLFSVFFCSCVRNTIEYEIPEGIAGLTIPAGFNWSSINEVNLTVVPSDIYNGEYYYLIEVFDGNPVVDTSAVLLAKGVAKKNSNFITKLAVSSSKNRLYVRQTDPFKLETVQTVETGNSSIICDFNVSEYGSLPLKKDISSSSLRSSSAISINETPSDATRITSNLGAGMTLAANTAYVIPSGYTYTGKINFSSGSSLYVEGSLLETAENAFRLSDGTKIVVQSSGVVDAGTANQNFYAGSMINYGTITLGQLDINSSVVITNYSGNFTTTSKLITRNSTNKIFNYASMLLESADIINGSVENMGYLMIKNTLEANGATFTNSGTMISGNISSTNSVYYADCGMEVLGDFADLNGSTIYIKEGSIFKSVGFDGSGTKIYFESGSIFEATDVTFTSYQSIFQCTGNSYALARMVNVKPSSIYSAYQCVYYKGKLEIETTSHYNGSNMWNPFYISDSKVRWSKTGASTTSILTGNCNGGGNTVVFPVTTPSNPVYPIEVPTSSYYTLLMEDQWPSIGDYDMNDLVLGITISYSQNWNNLVTSMILNTELKAVGARNRIGAAFQFDELLPGNIKSVSYKDKSVITNYVFPRDDNGCENGQTKAVIPIFDDAHSVMDPSITLTDMTRMINTFNNQISINPKTNSITINFVNPVDPALISIMKLNFFIVTNGGDNSVKRTEIHLGGFSPTNKNDWTKLGRGYDNSLNGVYYTTPGNMIWGLLIPVNFNYSAETINITEAYPQFSGWCTSGGINYTNWYNNPINMDGYIYIAK
jgi:LruC domain-containing protein